MELVKLIPQAFFEFFARLVPGILALTLWFGLLGSPTEWSELLNAVTAKKLNSDNVISTILLVGLSSAYVVGQLAAPFGKLFQRIAECSAKWLNSKNCLAQGKDNQDEMKDYDWLRANHPASGALAAKIRAESTMFYSMSAVLFASLVGFFALPTRAGTNLVVSFMIVALLSIACLVRGYSTGKTHKDTARKLREGHVANPKRESA